MMISAGEEGDSAVLRLFTLVFIASVLPAGEFAGHLGSRLHEGMESPYDFGQQSRSDVPIIDDQAYVVTVPGAEVSLGPDSLALDMVTVETPGLGFPEDERLGRDLVDKTQPKAPCLAERKSPDLLLQGGPDACVDCLFLLRPFCLKGSVYVASALLAVLLQELATCNLHHLGKVAGLGRVTDGSHTQADWFQTSIQQFRIAQVESFSEKSHIRIQCDSCPYP